MAHLITWSTPQADILRCSPYQSALSDEEDETESSASESDSDCGGEPLAFPELDDKIRQAISEYGAVFPKLNFSSPRVSTPPLHSFMNAYREG